MKRFFCITIIILIISSLAEGQPPSYRSGEKVTYTIQYGLFTAGNATLELTNDTFNRRDVWRSKLSARTTGMAEALFKVLDIYESDIDPSTELPVRSIRNIHEGHYKKYNVVLFDHKTRPDSSILSSDLTGQHIAPPKIHDILSCFYFFRNHLLPRDTNFLIKGEIITI